MRVIVVRPGQLTLNDIGTTLDYYDVIVITNLPGYVLTTVLPNGIYYVNNANELCPANDVNFLYQNNLLRGNGMNP